MLDTATNIATSSSPEQIDVSEVVFDHLTFSYREYGSDAILDDLSARFQQDRISLLTGLSGCGKSTLLYLAAGLYPRNAGDVSSGEIKIGGQDPSILSPRERATLVGMVFQNPSLQFCMDTVENELRFCLGNASTPRDSMPAAIDLALELCVISHLRTRSLRTLSGGEKQLVALACVMVLKPQWILLDEPFANVDDESARNLVQRIHAIHQQGVGILVVDHRIDHWKGIADHVWNFESPHRLREMLPEEAERICTGRSRRWRQAALEQRPPKKNKDDRLELIRVEVMREKQTVLGPIDYVFRSGQVYAITGRSGSGKSTLFDAMLGATAYDGTMLLGRAPLHRRRRTAAGSIGFVMQQPQDQFVADTVFEEISASVAIASEGNTSIDDAVQAILRPIGLWEYRDFSPYMLSQGQQRRLGVASLVPYQCQVLVCDEPTYAQDDNRALEIMSELLALVRDRGITLIFSTHDLALARSVADTVLRLEAGQLHEVD